MKKHIAAVGLVAGIAVVATFAPTGTCVTCKVFDATTTLAEQIAGHIIGQARATQPVQDRTSYAQAIANSIALPDLCDAAKTIGGDVAQVVGFTNQPAPDERAFVTLKCGDGTYRGIRIMNPAKYEPPAVK